MRTHIFLLALTALLASACASHEGRNVASTQQQQEAVEYSKVEAPAGKDFNRN
jgi:uncharacterized protein YcfL